MIEAIIRFSIRRRYDVIGAALLLALAGVVALRSTPLDAIPDLSDIQVIVYSPYPGQSPQVVEDQVTYPISTGLLSVPKAKVVRGYSYFGFSLVYVIFEEGTDLYWARSRVLENLNAMGDRMPEGVMSRLGPDATGVGWIYEYALVDRTGKHDLAQLRSIQDWYLRFQLQVIPGVAETGSVGGYVKQYQVEVNPNALAAYGIPLARVRAALARSNRDAGGGVVEMGETEYMVWGKGYIRSIEDIYNTQVGTDRRGTPIPLRSVADVHLGPQLRRGLSELDGQGEVVGGIVVMRYEEDALKTIQRVRDKLEELKTTLPEGVELITVYDRGTLIERAVENLWSKLLEESIVVALLCLAFLLHARSALVVVITLPMGILAAFVMMRLEGINANIMSLGGIAIAIGAMVDGAVVLVENSHKRLVGEQDRLGRSLTPTEHWKTIGEAAAEVGPALFFSLAIITVSFIPVFSLQAQEGRLFAPLAYTKTFAMAAAAVLAITLTPVLLGFLVTGKLRREEDNPINRWLQARHRPLLNWAMARPRATVAVALALMVVTLWPLARVGSEFMPPLDEGDILYMPTTFPGISISKARELTQQTDKILMQFPEVLHVFGKVGRDDMATDPAPLSMLESIIQLKPREQWPDSSKSIRELMSEMDRAIQFPGVANAWTMPIKTRIDMLTTGIRTPIGVKLSGPSMEVLAGLAEQVEGALKTLPETTSAYGDRAVGGYYIEIEIDRVMAARFGLLVNDIQEVITTAIGGMNATWTVEGLERYAVNVRYPRELRDSVEALQRVLITSPIGRPVTLGQVARIETRRGPPVIKSEGGRPNAWVYADLQGEDIGGYVEKAKRAVKERVVLPPGYTLTWSGQFEYMERAAQRLRILIPITLLLIFGLLYFNFRNLTAPAVVMLSIPFAVTGGFWLVYLAGYNLSVAVGVGFIALAGVAAEIGVLVITFIDHEVAARRAKLGGRALTRAELKEAARHGAAERVRAVAMTSAAIFAGLLPIFWGQGAGTDVMSRIAAPMVGGVITTTVLSLVVLPVVYYLVLAWQEERRNPPAPPRPSKSTSS
ncbi:MAG: CusA/CzcA family heavy metal efflux RND transporter [Deltaproteobacteria bacterium]|nr:CusA/CzcA family heavy metal efflux RND transporter [Deltaproteobacteria bacterium]